MRLSWLFVLVSLPAAAERYVVRRGETIEHVARTHGCSTEAVERANHLDTTLVAAGTLIEVPACRAARAAPVAAIADDRDDDRAKRALAVIDGVTWVAPTMHDDLDPEMMDGPTWAGNLLAPRTLVTVAARPSESVGAPWAGELAHAKRLSEGDGYIIKRPARSFGTKRLIDHLRGAISEVRALYPNLHTLAIGDISAEFGGKISDHRSHQSGLDVDVGFYFKEAPATHAFIEASPSNLDLEATWALLAAFTRIAALDDGVQMIFLDYDVQRQLYAFAKQRGTRDEELEFIFQYPRGQNELAGLVRHWPGHQNHMHVRFKP